MLGASTWDIFIKSHFAKFLSISAALYVLFHIAFVQLPPVGNHVWRQSNSLALAKNYFEEDMNITHPRVDKRYNQVGVTGANFPLYEWGLAVVYQMVGFSHSAHRIYALIITLLCFLLVYYIFKNRSETAGRIAAWLFLFNPLIFYYGFSALPDMMAILSILLVDFLVLKILKEEKWYYYILIALALAIGVMIKFTYVLWLAIPFLLADSAKLKPFRWKLLFTSFIALIPTVIWYKHAQQLTENSGGLVEFVYHARFIGSWLELKLLVSGLLATLPEMFFGYPAMLLLLVLFIYRSKQLTSASVHPFYSLSIFALCLGYFVAASHNLINHDYYLLPFLGIMLVFLSKWPIKSPKWVLSVILALMPIWSALRVIPSNWVGEDKNKLTVETNAIAGIVKKSDRVICGVDPTGCYMFYMLGVKGFPYDAEGDLSKRINKSETYIEWAKKNGASYLITNNFQDTLLPEVQKYLKGIAFKSNEILVLKLKE